METANTLLHADYKLFIHEASGTEMLRTLLWSIPATLKDHISYIYPTSQCVESFIPSSECLVYNHYTLRFISPASGSPSIDIIGRNIQTRETRAIPLSGRARKIPTGCASSVSPACLQALYNIPLTPATHSPPNALFVSGFEDQVASQNDLLVSDVQNTARVLLQAKCSITVGIPQIKERILSWTPFSPVTPFEKMPWGYTVRKATAQVRLSSANVLAGGV